MAPKTLFRPKSAASTVVRFSDLSCLPLYAVPITNSWCLCGGKPCAALETKQLSAGIYFVQTTPSAPRYSRAKYCHDDLRTPAQMGIRAGQPTSWVRRPRQPYEVAAACAGPLPLPRPPEVAATPLFRHRRQNDTRHIRGTVVGAKAFMLTHIPEDKTEN